MFTIKKGKPNYHVYEYRYGIEPEYKIQNYLQTYTFFSILFFLSLELDLKYELRKFKWNIF